MPKFEAELRPRAGEGFFEGAANPPGGLQFGLSKSPDNACCGNDDANIMLPTWRINFFIIMYATQLHQLSKVAL